MVTFVCWVSLLYVIFVWLFWFCLWVHMCIFSHTFYCCYKPLPPCWAFAVLWSFPFLFPFFLSSSFFNFFSLFYNFNFLTYYIFSTFIPLFALPTVHFPLQLISNAYKSSSSTSVFFAYLFFLFFLYFSLNIFVSFIFIALFPN